MTALIFHWYMCDFENGHTVLWTVGLRFCLVARGNDTRADSMGPSILTLVPGEPADTCFISPQISEKCKKT